MSCTSVVVVDDHTLVRERLRRSLESAGFAVVADVGDAESALKTAERTRPMVVLLDVSLPGRDGIEVARQFLRQFPGTAVVMLSMFADERTVRASFGAGAVAYLTKDCSTAETLGAVREAARCQAEGRSEPTRSYVGTTSDLASRRLPGGQLTMTPREVEVLQMLANGASNTEVGRELYISAKTVKNHLARIYSKLAVQSRTQAVAKALRLGLVRIA